MNFEGLIEKDFSGCISVTQKGKVLFEKAFGYADLSNKIPNELDTKFATASAGKVFVAVGILQLVEQGKLKLEDTIGSIINIDWKLIDKNITIAQLLSHTSGIPDYFDETIMENYDELWTDYPNYKIRRSSDLLPLFIEKPMMYNAGEKFQYNNTGFVVLGLIIEETTGQAFDEYLDKAVFKPSGMHNTGYYELDRLPAKCANAYLYDNQKGEFYTNIYSVDAKGTGAGGAFTTVLDINMFWKAFLNGKLISFETLDKMLSLQSSNEDEFYGYGIWLEKTENNKFVPHFEGLDPGVSFISCYDTINDICVTAVSNFCCNVWKIKRDIFKEIEC